MTIPPRPEHGHGFLVARIREIDQELGHQSVVPLAPSYIAELNERRARFQGELDAVEAYQAATPGTPAFVVQSVLPPSTIRRDKNGKFLGIDIEPYPDGKEWEVVQVRLITRLTDTTVLVRFDNKFEMEYPAAVVFNNAADAEADIPHAAKRLDKLLASFGPEFDAACLEIAGKTKRKR